MAYNRTLQHFTSSQELATVWASGQNYIVNQLVIESNKLYRCTVAHTSGATFAGDSANWSGLNPGQTVSISEGGTGQTTQTAAFDALAPTTTAGDIIVHNGTDNVRQAIGSDGQVLVVDTTAGNKLKWATLQQGAKNYIQYGTFENNALTGWNEASVTWSSGSPSGAPTISATAAASITLAVTNTNPLAGSYSLQMVGTIAQGQGFCTDALTIDREDQAKVLQGSFYYEVVSGATNANWSGTSSNTLSVWIYDVTNSTWQQPAGVYNLVQSSGSGICSFTFQTASNASQLRMFVFAANTASGSITVNFDDFRLGPQVTAAGAAITDWQSFTPTISSSTGTVTNYTVSAQYRRVGDSIQVNGIINFNNASAAFNNLLVSLPSGLSIDVAKLKSLRFGSGTALDQGAAYYPIEIVYVNTTSVVLYVHNAAGTYVSDNNIQNNVPFTFNNLDSASFEFFAPIVGWSSNTAMSDSSDTRVVAAQGTFATTSIPTQGAEGSETRIEFNSVTTDTHGATTITTNSRYTAPVSGQYRVSAFLADINATGAFAVILKVFKNGSVAIQRFARSDGAASQSGFGASTTLSLNAGDYIDFRIFQNSGTAKNFATSSYWSIERLSGPATVAATETVAMRANTSGNTIASPSSALVSFATKSYDTHNAWSGSVFTAPVSGKYQVNCHVYFAGASWSAGLVRSIQLVKGGSGSFTEYLTLYANPSAYTGALGLNGSSTIDLLAGDTLSITLQHNEGTSRNLDTTAGVNVLSITRVGN